MLIEVCNYQTVLCVLLSTLFSAKHTHSHSNTQGGVHLLGNWMCAQHRTTLCIWTGKRCWRENFTTIYIKHLRSNFVSKKLFIHSICIHVTRFWVMEECIKQRQEKAHIFNGRKKEKKTRHIFDLYLFSVATVAAVMFVGCTNAINLMLKIYLSASLTLQPVSDLKEKTTTEKPTMMYFGLFSYLREFPIYGHFTLCAYLVFSMYLRGNELKVKM